MCKYIIEGDKKLQGEILISGAKNSVLPILASTILNQGISVLKNCPDLRDVRITLKILESLGCKTSFENGTIVVNSSDLNSCTVSTELASELRSSIIFMGPLLARYNKVDITYPGGCEIGTRPIDIHIKSLKTLGVKFSDIDEGRLYATFANPKATEINLDLPSVGATENIILASVFLPGITKFVNVAREPEIVDLQNYLNGCGAKILGAGTDSIIVEGVKKLKNFTEYTVVPDRIEAGTFMTAAAMTKGTLEITNIIPEHVMSITSVLREAGCKIDIYDSALKIEAPGALKAVDSVRTQPYPGFPTDMQAQIVAMMSIANGTGLMVETIFENRFKHVGELRKMGAKIKLEGRTAIITGINKLHAANVNALDLRAGAAMVLAGLAAEGTTTVHDERHIERGYEDICKKLKNVGAKISSK
jgi:UDP-N-acetylglucosamine 1-carboxyvinyltransferase